MTLADLRQVGLLVKLLPPSLRIAIVWQTGKVATALRRDIAVRRLDIRRLVCCRSLYDSTSSARGPWPWWLVGPPTLRWEAPAFCPNSRTRMATNLF